MAENNTQNNTVEKIKNNFNNNKPAWIVGIIVVLLAVIAVASPWGRNDKDEVKLVDGCPAGALFNIETGEKCPEESAALIPEGCEPGFNFSVKTGLPCVKKEESKSEPAKEPVAPSSNPPAPVTSTKSGFPSLAEALEIYKGKSFAVGTGCSITPSSQTLGRGTKIMIHNATKTSHTVLVAGQSLTLKPFYYRTVTLSTAGTVAMKCDGKPAATLIVK
jgi:hypothetical protein